MASKRYSGRLVVHLIQVARRGRNFTAYSVRIRSAATPKAPVIWQGRIEREPVPETFTSEEWALSLAAQSALHVAHLTGARTAEGETIEQLAEVDPQRHDWGTRRWRVSRDPPEARENPARPRAATGTPTRTNVFTMRAVLQEHDGVVPDRVPSTDLSHLRRCIAAGLLVRGPEGGWVATDAGRAAMRGLDLVPWTFRDNPAPHPTASACSRAGAKLATRRSPRAGKALRACASKPSPHARPRARR